MHRTTSKDGTTLAYDVYGSGPALIYITGAICFRSFKPIVDDAKEFAKEFTVYNYDRRGRGDSGDTLPYALEREIEDIDAMIDAAGGTAYLYGHSSGAVLALEAAMRLGEKVKKIVLYDPSYVHDEDEKSEFAELRERVQALLDEGKFAQAIKIFLKGIGMPALFVSLLPLFPGWSTMKALAPTLAYDIFLTSDLPPLVRVATLSTPMHVVVGAKSPVRLKSSASQIANAAPNASLLELAGQDHQASATAVLPVLTAFLKG